MVNADESFRRLDCDDDDSSSNSHSYRSNSSHRDELNKSLSDRLKFTFSESLSNTTNFDDPRDESFVGGKDAESGGSVTLSTTTAHENEEKEDEDQEKLEQQQQQQRQLHRHRKDGQRSCKSLMDSSDDRMDDDHHMTACSTGTRPRASSENHVEFLKDLLKSSSFSTSSLSPASAAAAPLEMNPHPSDTSGENCGRHAIGHYEAALKGIDDSDYDDEGSVDSLLEHLPPMPDLDDTPTKHESPGRRRSLTEALSTRTNQEREMTVIPSQQHDEDEDEEGSTSSASLNDLFVSPTISCYKEKNQHSMPLRHAIDLLGSRSDVLSSKQNRQRTHERSANGKKKRSQLVTKHIEHCQHSASTRSLPGFCGSPTAASIPDIRTERPKPHRTKSASDVMLDHRNRKEGRANHSARRSRGGTPQGIVVDCSTFSSCHGERRGRRIHSCRNNEDERTHSHRKHHGAGTHRSLFNSEKRRRSSSHTSNSSAPGSQRVVGRQELKRSSSYSHRHHTSTHSSGNRKRCNSNSDRRGRPARTSSRSHSISKSGKEGRPRPKSTRTITDESLNDSCCKE